MYCVRNVTETVYWVGSSDRRLALFENLFPIPRGVSYNSYLIQDEKTALMDTVDSSVNQQFLENIAHVLEGGSLDYLVVNHMEPDHCALIGRLLELYPQMQVVGNTKTIQMIQQFYDADLEGRTLLVKEGDTLALGEHTLHFVTAPMVHWPEVMMAYEEKEKLLFTADAFGTFGALDGNLFNDEVDFETEWLPDARRYYTNIVGKYGAQVQTVLKKAAGLEISMLCPLHGPVWRSNLEWFINKYDKWSRYEPEEKAVAVMYGSMYGNTENAACVTASELSKAGIRNIKVYDISSTDVSELIAEAFRCSHLVLASPTYNGGLYPKMEALLNDMKALNVQGRTVGLIENGTWAPASGKLMRAALEGMKNMTVLEPVLTVKSSLKAEQAVSSVDTLVKEIAASVLAN